MMSRIRSIMLIWTVAVAASLMWPAIHSDALKAQQGGQVVIEIRNYTYEFHGGVLKPLEPATIVLRNKDDVTHGFNSTLFESLDVDVETDAGDTYGNGIKGVHIAPGKEIRIHFTPTGPGKHEFHCDIHKNMKGEILILAVGAVSRIPFAPDWNEAIMSMRSVVRTSGSPSG